MTLADLRRLLAYNEWANALTLASLAPLSDEQLHRANGSSFPSVLLTLGHLVGAEWIWLQRWTGNGSAKFPDWAAPAALDVVRTALASVEAERRAFVDGLEEAAVGRLVAFRLMNGTEDRQPLDVMVTHVVNHSTYHRGQIAAFLRQLGAVPASTDFIRYARSS